MIAVGSIVRDGMAYLERTIAQLERLHRLRPLRWILVEGDSTDGTKDFLRRVDFPFPCTVDTFDHGGPKFGSVDDVVRWYNISRTANVVLSHVTERDSAFVWVEADLIWEAETIDRLVALAISSSLVVAPMSMRGGTFYDTWGFRRNGARFRPLYPYFDGFDYRTKFYPIDSAGSCLAMRTEVALHTRYPEEPSGNDGIVGWCRNIREKGYEIVLCSELVVEHP